MMDFVRFVFSKRFLRHLGLAILLFSLLTWIVFLSLGMYTHHGDYLTVPNLGGMNIDKVVGNPDYQNFDFMVVDSLYILDKPKGMILNQDPFPDAHVKKNRTIYLTIVSYIPDKTSMPDLKFLTYRQAVSILESIGLKVGKIRYVRTFDEDAVQQQYSDGKVIEPGTKLDKGTPIDLVVGSRSKGGVVEAEKDTAGISSDSI
jgi:eukaryotic-like serine/threonine-protein kinase